MRVRVGTAVCACSAYCSTPPGLTLPSGCARAHALFWLTGPDPPALTRPPRFRGRTGGGAGICGGGCADATWSASTVTVGGHGGEDPQTYRLGRYGRSLEALAREEALRASGC